MFILGVGSFSSESSAVGFSEAATLINKSLLSKVFQIREIHQGHCNATLVAGVIKINRSDYQKRKIFST